jgi:type IV pilus modification protein PilV
MRNETSAIQGGRAGARRHGASAARRQRGVTLIEILVAVVLLSIGLLGLAGLQLRGMQVNQGSMWRAQAAIMAEDLADRMRADPNNAKLTTTSGGFYGTYTPANLTSTVATVNDWFAGFRLLPAGTITATAASGVTDNVKIVPTSCNNALPCVVVAPAAGTTQPTPIRIAIYWNDARAATGAIRADTNQVGSYTMVAALSEQY